MAGTQKSFWTIAVLAAALLAGGIWLWLGLQSADGAIRLTPGDAQTVAQGKTIYGEHCAQCHGANLEGQPNWRERLPSGRMPAPPHDRTGHTWHHPDAQLFDLTKRGPAAIVGGGYESDMPGYADVLSDGEIIAVLSYIKSTWSASIQARHDEINRRAAQAETR